MVAPFPAGGPVDTIARILGEHLQGTLGQPFIIEDVAGAAGSIGVGRVARAAPDGYTLSVGQWSTHVANAAIYKLPYDTLTDFQPIALLSNNPGLIVGRKDLPANNLKELVAWLKANPEKATQGTPGVGGFGHIGGVFFQKVTGTNYQFVPYRGAAPMMAALLAGQVDIVVDTPTTSIPQILGGAIKGFAVMSKTRLAAVPDVPTVDRGGHARPLSPAMECRLGAEGHAGRHRDEAQQGHRPGHGRSIGAPETCGSRTGNLSP